MKFIDKKTLIAIIVLLVLALGIGFLLPRSLSLEDSTAAQPIATASFSCDAGKTIAASFYDGPATPAAGPDQPPIPGGSVALVLSDGRSMTLPQTISADGARYANADESFIFWNKGNGAFVMEGDQQTYANCIDTASSPQNSASTTPAWEEGMTIVTKDSADTTVHLKLHERFVIQLGDTLNWTLAFDPSGGITRVANSTTENGIQGIYEADQTGTVTLHASGAPICKSGEACPQYLVATTVAFVIDAE